ncbi:MAG TPA: hypothetical protein IGS37_19055 [Synechococcales cyanobacterium M55_K2018_004]|nr:hypothetical protein [Synechococcales cyanobacterium M55_K2018_004]
MSSGAHHSRCQQLGLKRVAGAVGLALWLGTMPPGWAQTSLPAPVNCVQERNQLAENRVRDLLSLTQQHLERGRTAQAAATLQRALVALRQVPDVATRRTLLNTLSPGPETADDLLRLVVSRSSTQAVPPVLTEMLATVRGLGSGYRLTQVQQFTAIARHYTQIGNPAAALQALQEALEASRTVRGEDAQANALLLIIETAIDTRQNAFALPLLPSARQSIAAIPNLPADKQGLLLSRLAIAQAKLLQLDAATQTWQQVRSPAYARGMAAQALVRAYLQQQNATTALRIAETVTPDDAKARTFAEIGSWYASQGMDDPAIAQFTRALQIARPLTDDEFTLMEVGMRYAAHFPARTAAIAASLRDPEKRATVYGQVALGYFAQQQFSQATAANQQAIAAMRQMANDWGALEASEGMERAIAAQAYELAIQLAEAKVSNQFPAIQNELLIKIAQQTAARHQFDLALRAVQAIPAIYPDQRVQALQAIAATYVRANQTQTALQLVEQLPATARVQRVRLQGAIAHLLWQGGNPAANQVFERALQQARAIPAPADQVRALGNLAYTASISRQTAYVNQTLALAQQTTQTIQNPQQNAAALTSLTFSLISAGEYEKAVQLARTIRSQNERNAQLFALGDRAIAAGSYTATLQALDAMTVPQNRARLLLNLVRQTVVMGNPQLATTLLNRAVSIARTIPDPERRVETFVRDYDPQGNPITTLEIEDEFDRSSVLEAIALHYAELGQPAAALQTAGLIQDRTMRDRLIERIRCVR